MKLLAFALVLAMTSGAAAQIPLSRTVPFTDASGKQIGTATFWGNRVTLLDNKGEFIAQIVEENGKRSLYDPHGKLLDQMPVTPIRPFEPKPR